MRSNGSKLLAIAGFTVAAALVFVAFTIGWMPNRGTADTASAQGQTTSNGESRITVRGTGSVTVKPDTVKMSVGVSQQESTVKAAQAKVNTVSDAIVAELKKAGIDEKDYKTSQYTVEPVMDFGGEKGGPSQMPRLTGYRVFNVFEITLHDPSKAADLLDTLTSAGANLVNYVGYTVADPNSVSQQAYDSAVKDAETRATKLASLSKKQLGEIVSISDAAANVPGPVYQGDFGGRGGGGSGIYPGQQTVQVDVIVTYETK